MKSFTDLKQSKKLAEILPFESADMGWYYSRDPNAARNQMWLGTKAENADIPCWSLAALLGVLPSVIKRNDKRMFLTLEKAGAYNLYYKSNDRLDELLETDFEPVDACYEMILKLNEQKLI